MNTTKQWIRNLVLLIPMTLNAAWWEKPHDKWYFKDDWKGAAVNRFVMDIKLLSPATNGWIVIWGGREVRVNGKVVMNHVDRALIYDSRLDEFVRGATEVKLQAGPGRVVAEGELIDDQGRRYPFASGCNWPTPVAPGTKLEPAGNAYRPGRASGAFNTAHNGLLIRYNDEERGKADISKALASIQKLRDQSIFLLRRFRPAEDILSFSPEVLWRKAEGYANTRMLEAEKILKEQAIPAQKQDQYGQAIALAQKAATLLASAELAINSSRELEEAERHLLHLEGCAEIVSAVPADAKSLPNAPASAFDPQMTNSFAAVRKIIGMARADAQQEAWEKVQAQAQGVRNALAPLEAQLAKAWGGPIGKVDEFPEDRFGWFNAQGLLMNDPARWEFTTVNPAANWIDLSGVWSFHTDPPNKGEELGWPKPEGVPSDGWKTIHVPLEWEREGVLDENEYAPWDCPYQLGDARCEDKPYNGYAWYRRDVLVPKLWAGRNVVLRVGKVSNWLRVFLNGKQIGEPKRDGGVFALPGDILRPGEKNTLAIQVYNHDNFGGIVSGPVSLAVDDIQPDVVVTPGPMSWTYETAVQTTQGVERTVTFASQMTPAVVLSSDQDTLHLWGWEAKGFHSPAGFTIVSGDGNMQTIVADATLNGVSGEELSDSYIILNTTMLMFEQKPLRIAWLTNALGYVELAIQFKAGGWRVLLHTLDREDGRGSGGLAARPKLNRQLHSVPVSCSVLASLDKKNLQGQFFLRYHYLNIGDFTGGKSEPFAPLPPLLWLGAGHFPKGFLPENLSGIYFGQQKVLYPTDDLVSKLKRNLCEARFGTNTIAYRTPLIDKSKLLKGVGELFAKRRPDANIRGGNSEQQMFDDWKAWGFDHCRYAFAWNADWDLPLQRRLGGPSSDDPALWERLDYLVKQHTDRGIMAMLCYFFNEDSPQRDSKNLMRNSTRYWQMHPEVRTNCYELWRRIVQRYADYPADLVAYDFFNEPAYMHRDDWNRIIKDLTQIVRSVDNKHLIVCEAGDGWSQPQWFHWLKPTGDTNTIYSFHHYGKHWGYDYDEYYPGYKSTPEKQMDVLLEAIIFGLRHNVPLHCGEFGVSMISPGDDHLVWLDDYLALFERFGIGWNWWNWDGNGIYRTGLKAGEEISPNLRILQKWIAKKKEW